MKNKIEEVLNSIRPYLNMDGGDIEYIKFEDGYVYVKLTGACMGCLYSDETINNYVAEALIQEIPEIKGVINTEI